MNRRAVLLGLASTAMTPIPIVRAIPDVSTCPTSTVNWEACAIEQIRNAFLGFDIRPVEIEMSAKVAEYFERLALETIREGIAPPDRNALDREDRDLDPRPLDLRNR